jgi:hypothetical protein
MKKNQTGNMYNPMKVSDLINILEAVKSRHGDLPVWGECDECASSDMLVWVLTAASEMDAVIIQVSGTGLEE